MEIDKWIGSHKVRAFPWIDGKRIYFNVQYYAPGQSIEKPPVWDKTVYIANNNSGRRLAYDFTDSLVREICLNQLLIDGGISVIKCPLDMCKYNVAGTCTKDDVVLEIADIDEHLVCNSYIDENKGEEMKC